MIAAIGLALVALSLVMAMALPKRFAGLCARVTQAGLILFGLSVLIYLVRLCLEYLP